jgi:L,D-transpeptidase ErfK/SrfK
MARRRGSTAGTGGDRAAPAAGRGAGTPTPRLAARAALALAAAALLASAPARAEIFPAGAEVVGELRHHVVRDDESLIEVAREHDLGYNEIADANRDLDSFVPDPGAEVLLPTAFVLPRAVAPGTLVVNLSELRLYYLVERGGRRHLVTFPVGIGSEGTETPPGRYRVAQRIVRPSWYPPPSVRRERPELPPVVPPGPENPLGSHALRLSGQTILIHGTNRPYGVGRRVSHGCIRLYPEDIPRLFDIVGTGTPVLVVREPVKVGMSGGRVYLEVHADEESGVNAVEEATRLLAARGWLGRVDSERLLDTVEARTGVPTPVSGPVDRTTTVRTGLPVPMSGWDGRSADAEAEAGAAEPSPSWVEGERSAVAPTAPPVPMPGGRRPSPETGSGAPAPASGEGAGRTAAPRAGETTGAGR